MMFGTTTVFHLISSTRFSRVSQCNTVTLRVSKWKAPTVGKIKEMSVFKIDFICLVISLIKKYSCELW